MRFSLLFCRKMQPAYIMAWQFAVGRLRVDSNRIVSKLTAFHSFCVFFRQFLKKPDGTISDHKVVLAWVSVIAMEIYLQVRWKIYCFPVGDKNLLYYDILHGKIRSTVYANLLMIQSMPIIPATFTVFLLMVLS